MAFMIVVFLFPAYPDPGVYNMNYAVVVFGTSKSFRQYDLHDIHSIGGILILATIYFYFPKYGGKCWFKGPIRTIDVMDPRALTTTQSDEKSGI